MGKKRIKVYWVGGRRGTINFGDILNKDIITFLTGAEVKYSSPSKADVAAAGSLLQHVTRNAWKRPLKGRFAPLLIWGSGSKKPTPLGWKDFLDVRAVRGPLTKDSAGLPKDTALGDPGLLAPLLLEKDRPREPNAMWGLVPHLYDRPNLEAVTKILERLPDAKLIDVTNPDALLVSRQIASCEAILSSSLHGVIVADAFGIPNARIKITAEVPGGDWKFKDYFLSVGRGSEAATDVSSLNDMLCLEQILERAEVSTISRIQDTLLATFQEIHF